MKLPRHSTVVAYLALFTALGGTSYAAVELKANSVGSRELKANSVGSSEIKARSIQPSDMALDARLTKSNKAFSRAVTDVVLDPDTQSVVNALAGAVKGEKGDPGAAGAGGATGASGATGAAGVSGYVIRDSVSPTISSDAGDQSWGAMCESGERALGGGGRWEGTDNGMVLRQSYPNADGAGWTVILGNSGFFSAGKIHAFVVCAKAA